MSEYEDRDHVALGNYYTRHVSAMTAEGLHAKSDIAAELAWRDWQIACLRRALSRSEVPAGWQPISEAPVFDFIEQEAPKCLVYGKGVGVHMGRAWRYPGGEAQAQAFGFHGDWQFTHFHPLPTPPAQGEQAEVRRED